MKAAEQTMSADEAPHCTGCQAVMESPLVCSSCRRLFDSVDCNAFEAFGLPVAFDIDDDVLRARFLRLARQTHPDRFAAQTPGDRAAAERVNARLNEAYETLRRPASRAEYLLRLAGGPTADEERFVPPEVLNDALLLREEIDEARAAGDEDALAALREQVRMKYDAHAANIAELARKLPTDRDATLRPLRVALNSIRYYERMLEQLT
ncbi:MAG: Fe-S protein assembly co-chaperone HscB [Planctomycetota bacterium]|nr:MAG: Fe-S protein assembly co-chaperone HscB [Planctomycetota bacterium]